MSKAGTAPDPPPGGGSALRALLAGEAGARRRLAGLGVLVVLSALTEGVGLVLLVPMLAALGAGDGGAVGAWLADIGIPAEPAPLLAIFVALVVARALLAHARALAAQRFEMATVDGLRARAWSALLHCDWRTLSAMRQSENASLLITNVDRVGHGVSQAVAAMSVAVTLAGIGAAALAIAPLVALGGAAGGLGVLVAYRGLRRRAAALGEQLGSTYADMHGRLTEALSALRVIKSFGREGRAERDATAAVARMRGSQYAYYRSLGLGQVALQSAGALVLAGLVWLAVARWQAGPAQIIPLVALFARALPLVGALQEAWQNWAHARPALSATLDLIARAEAAREPASEAPAPAFRKEIALAGVTVRFAGRDGPALDRVDLVIPAGATVAVSGPSGAGKSTLADLLCGLLAPDEGRVTVDGVALDAASRRAWRTRVAYVQQEPVLFAGTVRENLAWADPDADEARLRRALADASAGFVLDLPDGLDTDLGDGGRRLSGGERQRLALARALLRDPDLLVLDEASSALDAANEALIGETLRRLHGRLAIVVIGHRGALAETADVRIALDSGRVVPPRVAS